MKRLIFGLIYAETIFQSIPGHTVDLYEESNLGKYRFSQIIAAGQDFGGSENEEQPWRWNAGFRYDQLRIPNTGSPDSIEITRGYNASLEWSGDPEWWATCGFDYSQTPAEELSTRSLSCSGSYTWHYQIPSKKNRTRGWFSPSLSFKLNLGTADYIETFTGTRTVIQRMTRRTVPLSGSESIRQGLLGFDLSWRPLRSWRFQFGVTKFGYNRGVTQFENYLNSPMSLARGISGFSNTIGGLPSVSYNVSVNWYFLENWKAMVKEYISVAAVGGSVSTTTRGLLEYHFAKDWRATMGLEHDKSTTLSDTLGILGLECDI